MWNSLEQRIRYALRTRTARRHWLRLVALTALALWCFSGRTAAVPPGPASAAPLPALPAEAALDLRVLQTAYPDAIKGLERGASGFWELVLADGTRLVYDDGRTRTAKEAEETPDVRTMLAQVYPTGRGPRMAAERAFDPANRAAFFPL